MKKYIYESCLGSFFSTDEALTFEEAYCEQCGDSDWLHGYLTKEECREYLTEHMRSWYEDEGEKTLKRKVNEKLKGLY